MQRAVRKQAPPPKGIVPFDGIERRRSSFSGEGRSIPLDVWILNALLDGSADSVSAIGRDGNIRFITKAGPDLSGADRQATNVGLPWLDQWPKSCIDTLTTAIATARAGRSARCDVSFQDSRGDRCWWEICFSSCRGAQDRDYAGFVVAVARDVTDRFVALEAAQVLARESQHRYCNMLSMIQAIVRISAGASRDQAQFISSIEDRIDALARNHLMLTRNGHGAVDIRALLQAELAPYSGLGLISIHGPPTAIGEPLATALGLAIHELTSNAIKHGALSRRRGRLGVSWDDKGDQGLTILWRETGVAGSSGGPPGFGSMLLDQLLSDQLGIGRSWLEDGLLATISTVAQFERVHFEH